MGPMDMDRQELIERLQEAAREFEAVLIAHGAHEPDWEPLEKVLPIEWCGGFMFMGYIGNIRAYKHGFTRAYLHLDPECRAYFYREATDSYYEVPVEVAIEAVFEDLEEMGFERSTPFDEEHQAARLKALTDAGWTIIGVDVAQALKERTEG